MRWFRFYSEVLHDPKVQKLTPELFKVWVNVLCLASEHDGILPSLDDVAFALRADIQSVSSAFHALEKAGLLDNKSGRYSPHNWKKRQFKSDTSTERVKRFRNGRKDVTETAPEQIQSRADTETEESRGDADTPAGIDATSGHRGEDSPTVAGRYAFEGNVIKLTERDFNRWKASFGKLDVPAELEGLDSWLVDHPEKQKSWFNVVSGALAKKQRETPEKQKRNVPLAKRELKEEAI